MCRRSLTLSSSTTLEKRRAGSPRSILECPTSMFEVHGDRGTFRPASCQAEMRNVVLRTAPLPVEWALSGYLWWVSGESVVSFDVVHGSKVIAELDASVVLQQCYWNAAFRFQTAHGVQNRRGGSRLRPNVIWTEKSGDVCVLLNPLKTRPCLTPCAFRRWLQCSTRNQRGDSSAQAGALSFAGMKLASA